VPFTVQIPISERDPNLSAKLKAEWPAILRWCLNGCLEWQRIGLAPPKSVQEATEGYFGDQDTVGQWLDEHIEDGDFTRIRDLFSSWSDWCEARNHRPGTSTALSELLADRGFIRKREAGTGQRGFAGLAIKTRRV
jgi:putative DNA primase/helicase